MERKFLKRILSTVLALSIAVPGGALTARAETQTPAEPSDLSQYVTERGKDLIDQERLEKADVEKTEVDLNKEVRVIIEFETVPNRVSLFNNGTSTLSRINSEQADFFNEVDRTGLELTKLKSFKEVFNGSSVKVALKDIPAIESMSGVKKVYLSQEYERPEPMMIESVDTIGAPFAWESDYKGEGFVVGVIDSGFDTEHQDFVLTNPDLGKIKERSLIGKDLKGMYINPKFPYGYNYYDQNTILKEAGESHGQHVTGTVAANGEIKGVAPEAQVLALRVFSNDPLFSTTFDDIYMEAMEEGVVLGADAFNLSLGSPAGFSTFMESALDQAVLNARMAGVVVAMSAGNDHNLVDGWSQTAADWMPDQGVTGSPGQTPESISVASSTKTPKLYENTYVTYETEDGPVNAIVLPASASPDPVDTLGEEPLPFVDAGYGSAAAYAAAGAEGKVALVSRGGDTPNFVDKLANAEAAGAIALIVYDNRVGDYVNMAGEPTIPYMFMSQADGLAILALPEGERMISFGRTEIENPTIQISDFSSWGSTPDLRLKPEITAPGTAIYSTLNDDTYGVMSGTSMASPHVAGAAAVVREYMSRNEPFKSMTNGEKARLSKVLLMNSANVLLNNGIARSPRAQGAGLMNLQNLVETRTLAYNPANKEAKLELKEVAEKALDLNVTVENFGNEALTYTAEVILLTDDIEDGHYTELSRNVEFALSGNTELTVAAGAKAPLNLKVDFSADEIASEQFIEGFIVLTDNNGSTTTVPFMGFYGNWSKPLMLDNFRSDLGMDPDGESFFMASGLLTELNDGGLYYLENGTVWLNPANPISWYVGTNNIYPYLSLLRNAEELKFSILNETKESIFTIGSVEDLRKINRLYAGTSPVRIVNEGVWYGNLQDGYIPDGKYFYEIKGRINYENAVEQTKQIPLLVDHTAPVITNAKIEWIDGKYILSFEATDGPADRGVGVGDFIVSSSFEGTDNDLEFEANEDNVYSIDVTANMMETDVEETGMGQLYIFAYDLIYNGGVTPVTYTYEDTSSPIIIINEPVDISETTEVLVKGAVLGITDLETIEISSGDELIVAEPTYVAEGLVYDLDGNPIYYGPHWTYEETITMEPGYTPVKVMARATNGIENSINRYIYVDDGDPELTVSVQDRDPASAKAVFDIDMSDALPYLQLYLNGEQIFLFDGFDASVAPAAESITHEVDLKVGDNYFDFELVDAIGNVTTLRVKVTRGESGDKVIRIFGSNRYLTAIEVSREAFETADTVLIVDGQTGVDSLLAGPLAVQINAPILMVGKTGLTNELTAELRRLGATNAIIIGGELVVPESTKADLEALGMDVERIGGRNRYQTSVMVDSRIRDYSGNIEDAVIANGYTMFDALAIGAPAGKMGVGVLFNDGKTITPIESALADVTNVYLLGGALSESEAVEDALIAKDIEVERVSGATRYSTAVAIAERFYKDVDRVIVANGTVPFDALTSVVLSAKYNAPLLLTPATTLSPETRDYILNLMPKMVYVLGGELAISEEVRLEIEALLKTETIKLVSINDFHGNAVEGGKNPGLAKIAGVLNEMNEENQTYFLSAGDNFQGTAISNLTHGAVVNEAFRLMDLTASAIGNHEYDWGKNMMTEWSEEGGYPFLASNIEYKDSGEPVDYAEPWMIETVTLESGKEARIGIIGIATPETATKTLLANVADINFTDPVAATEKWVTYLRETEKVDAVVALTHLGGFMEEGVLTGELKTYVDGIEGVDLVFSGHTHQTIDTVVNGVQVLQAYYNGRSLSVGSLTFNTYDSRLLAVDGNVDEIYKRVADLPVDQEVADAIAAYEEALAPILNEVIGTNVRTLDHDPGTTGLTPLGQWSAKTLSELGETDIAIINGGGIREPMPEGDITMGTMYALFPFDNTLVTLKVKGSKLFELIEHGIDPPSFRDGQFYGVKVTADLTKPYGSRITSMTLQNGDAIEPDTYYSVSTLDFVYTGGDMYDFDGAIEVFDTFVPVRDALAEHIKEVGTVDHVYDATAYVVD